MRSNAIRCVIGVLHCVLVSACISDKEAGTTASSTPIAESSPAAAPATAASPAPIASLPPQVPPPAPAPATPPPPQPAVAHAAAPALAAPASSNATGCAPGSRCITVTGEGQPSSSGSSIAQCRGEFADFIVPKDTIPANYAGPWFQPALIEKATTNGPTGSRPWQSFNPAVVSERLKYLLALRNYAFASRDLRAFTPTLISDTNYRDPAGGAVRRPLRSQKWYPAPRMIYGVPSTPGTREAARGMTLERSVPPGELAGNLQRFVNYAVAYYDARGAHAYQQVWSTATPGKDAANTAAMQIPEGALVYKLLFSAAKPTDFPQDILQNSVSTHVIPNAGGQPVPVRLLQIDIAVKDSRAGATGWYFATYAYDRTVSHPSPWRRMVPVGLMWGNDPGGPPLTQSWINANAPAYARQHLGVDGRLNGPVDNPASACMSCHGTAQAPAVAQMLPQGACNQPPFRANWFRNLPGSQAFGRFTPTAQGCVTTPPATAPVAADYSLQLAATVSRALSGAATFNPCTWDTANPPSGAPASPVGLSAPAAAPRARAASPLPSETPVFPVTRDP